MSFPADSMVTVLKTSASAEVMGILNVNTVPYYGFSNEFMVKTSDYKMQCLCPNLATTLLLPLLLTSGKYYSQFHTILGKNKD